MVVASIGRSREIDHGRLVHFSDRLVLYKFTGKISRPRRANLMPRDVTDCGAYGWVNPAPR
jgi:hypothetical protein